MDNTHAIMQQHRCDELMMLAIFFFFVMEIGFICHWIVKNINVL